MRGHEHHEALQQGLEESRAFQHAIKEHGGERRFRMDVLSSFRNDAMLRQISEAVLIKNAQPDTLLNNKTEWAMNVLPHLNLSNSP